MRLSALLALLGIVCTGCGILPGGESGAFGRSSRLPTWALPGGRRSPPWGRRIPVGSSRARRSRAWFATSMGAGCQGSWSATAREKRMGVPWRRQIHRAGTPSPCHRTRREASTFSGRTCLCTASSPIACKCHPSCSVRRRLSSSPPRGSILCLQSAIAAEGETHDLTGGEPHHLSGGVLPLHDPQVRKAESPERSTLEGLEGGAEQRAKARPAGNEVVVSAEDDRALHRAKRQPGE